ncbi:hypothetical protein SLS60_000331 [Paraconiothyrium brasiliense]|uniref:F-box domain-containing protein n=1 Tax=Paraconiothyrium brasiliense TaxID=300254 RepID=A0ABR3S6I1_9PLEO
MSTPRPHLLSLAPEIVEHIIKQVSEKNDLSNVRLVCKTLDRYALEELFKDVFVSPSKEHMSAWNSISQDDIRRIPHYAIVQTRPYIEDERMVTALEAQTQGSNELEGIMQQTPEAGF